MSDLTLRPHARTTALAALKYSVRTAFYCSGFLALVALPQLLCHALGAPVTF